jgi:hypothetical protein
VKLALREVGLNCSTDGANNETKWISQYGPACKARPNLILCPINEHSMALKKQAFGFKIALSFVVIMTSSLQKTSILEY